MNRLLIVLSLISAAANAETSASDRAFAKQAALLTDREAAYNAAYTMLQLDAAKAGPILFTGPCDRNVQHDAFMQFTHRTDPRVTPGLVKNMHDAAIRCLEAPVDPLMAELALLALGVAGSKADFSLLEHHYVSQDVPGVWGEKMREAAEAALARLGNKRALRNLETKLAAPIPAEFSASDAADLHRVMMRAGFSHNARFVRLLCKHLDSPAPQKNKNSHSPTHHPKASAWQALDQIVNNASAQSVTWTKIDWTKWRKENVDKCK